MSRRSATGIVGLGALVACVALLCVWSLMVGSSSITPSQVADALLNPDESRAGLVVSTVRLPRLLAGLAAGSALAVAGALMQAMTNNPLASPGLLGINAGAAFAVVLGIAFLQPESAATYAWFAFLGAGLAGCTVYLLASIGPGGATPLKLALAGVILSSFVTSMTTAVLIFDKATLDVVRVWTVGSLAGRQMDAVLPLLVYVLPGLAVAMLLARHVTTLSLGSEIASSVGQDLLLWRLAIGGLVILLAGSAVAIAGPVGFVGLVVPHIARLMAGSDYTRIIPISALGGAILVLLADTTLRSALSGYDIPVGVTMAMIGAPFFIYLARSRNLAIR